MDEQRRQTDISNNPYNSHKVHTDMGEMQIPHSIVRGEFRRALGMVRNVKEGDARRAGAVAEHLPFLEAVTVHGTATP